MADRTHDGTPLRLLTVIDEYTRESLAIEVGRRLSSQDVLKSFNGKLRDELLAREIFFTLEEAQVLVEQWRRQYNRIRPHRDPREDVNALLDTASHIRFAIIQGEIAQNDLPALPAEEEEAKERRGWLAYTPPPMALPVSYGDETKWNRWETRWISGIFIGALVLDRMSWLDQDEASREQVGDLQTFDGGEIRALRFGAVGTLNFKNPWVYTVFLTTRAFDRGFDTTNDDALSFFDYRLDIPLPQGVTLSLGKQKAPISMERLMPLTQLPMQERTISADAMLTARDVGILVNGTGFEQRMTWAGGVFNDWFDAGTAFGDRATQGVGRVSALAFATPDDSHVLHIGLAGRYTNAEQGIQYARKPEFNRSPLFVDTGLLEAEGAFTWVGELAWRRGPLWIESEYTRSSLESTPNGDPTFGGYHVAACWAISGEMRGYNRRTGTFKALPVARSVYQGGMGCLGVVRSLVGDRLERQVRRGGAGRHRLAGPDVVVESHLQLRLELPTHSS